MDALLSRYPRLFDLPTPPTGQENILLLAEKWDTDRAHPADVIANITPYPDLITYRWLNLLDSIELRKAGIVTHTRELPEPPTSDHSVLRPLPSYITEKEVLLPERRLKHFVYVQCATSMLKEVVLAWLGKNNGYYVPMAKTNSQVSYGRLIADKFAPNPATVEARTLARAAKDILGASFYNLAPYKKTFVTALLRASCFRGFSGDLIYYRIDGEWEECYFRDNNEGQLLLTYE